MSENYGHVASYFTTYVHIYGNWESCDLASGDFEHFVFSGLF